MTDLRVENQSGDVDRSEDDEPVKFGDDAVTVDWKTIAINDRLRMEMTVEHRKKPILPFFTRRSDSHKERLDLDTFYNN